jgi:lipopolysaccharide biosynthesis regulator YciM
MLKAERLELAKAVRLRVKVAKNEVDKRVTRMLADVEAQLAAQYPSAHAAWKEITKQAEDYIAQADKDIAERCRALGIPEEFRPG